MSTSSIIDCSDIFIAQRRYKPQPVPQHQWVSWDTIKIKRPVQATPTEKQVYKYLRFLSEYGITGSIITNEEGNIIAGEKRYRVLSSHEPLNVPIYIIPKLSAAHQAALRQAYMQWGGRYV